MADLSNGRIVMGDLKILSCPHDQKRLWYIGKVKTTYYFTCPKCGCDYRVRMRQIARRERMKGEKV